MKSAAPLTEIVWTIQKEFRGHLLFQTGKVYNCHQNSSLSPFEISVNPEKQLSSPYVSNLIFFSGWKKCSIFSYLSLTGLVSPSKQLLAKQLLETNTLDFPALSMDAALDNLSPQPPALRLQQQQQQNPMASIPPRSAKITMEEAAESAVTLAGPDQSRMPGANSRLPNGRPPAIQTGTT